MAISQSKRGVKRFTVLGASLSAKKRTGLVKQVLDEADSRKVKALRIIDTASGSGHVRFAFPDITKKSNRRISSSHGKRIISR